MTLEPGTLDTHNLTGDNKHDSFSSIYTNSQVLVQTSHNGCVLYRMKWFTYQLCGLHLVDILVLYFICIDWVFLCNLPIPNSEGECEGEERLLRNSRLLHIQDKKQLRKTRKLRFNSLNYYLHSHFLQLDILWKIHFLKVRLNSLSQPLEFLPHKIIFKSSATVVKGRFYFMFSGWFNSKFQRKWLQREKTRSG